MLIYLAMIDTDSDRTKFEQIYQKYRHYLYACAFDILKNAHDAEDITQDCFLYIAQNITQFETVNGKKTLSLLTLLAKHRAIDLYRSRRSQHAVSMENCAESADPSDDFSAIENDVGGILGTLNPRYREILVLRFCHGYSYAEISDFMQITEAAARKILQRAREQFEKNYESQYSMQ